MKQAYEDRSHKRYFSQLVLAVTWTLAVSGAGAQDYHQGYRFAPQTPDFPGEAGAMMDQGIDRPGTRPGWTEPGAPLTGPGGRPYRFRNGYQTSEHAEQPVFRPDTRLGQQPKNWGSDPGWASDPVLQQGLVFRPLTKKGNGANRREHKARSAVPAVPPVYPYGPAVEPVPYPGFYGPGTVGDPATGLPFWSGPGTFGAWLPEW